MAQVNLSMKQTHRHEEQTCDCVAMGEGWIGSFRLAYANLYIWNG